MYTIQVANQMQSAKLVSETIQLECNALWHPLLRMARRMSEYFDSLHMATEVNNLQQDVAMLNVGGHIHHLSLQTVSRHRDSFFGALFSGSFELEEQSCAFVDRNGQLFHDIARYLRSGEFLIDLQKRNDVKRECAFYCLPPPPPKRRIVCYNWRAHWLSFLTEDGTDHSHVRMLTEHCAGLFHMTTNNLSTFIVHSNVIIEYPHTGTQWSSHDTTERPGAVVKIYATSSALYARCKKRELYELRFDDKWQWTKINIEKVDAITVSNDRLFVASGNAIFIYNPLLQIWEWFSSAPPNRVLLEFVITPHYIYARPWGRAVSMCDIKDQKWTDTPEYTYILGKRNFFELHGAMCTVYHNTLRKFDILSGGLLAAPVEVQITTQNNEPPQLVSIGMQEME